MLTKVKAKLRPRRAEVGPEDVEPLLAEIEELSAQNRVSSDPELERRILRLRQLAGIALCLRDVERPELVEPDYDALPTDTNLPEVAGADLTPGLIRAAILRHGAILVRGLIDEDVAAGFTEELDRAYASRDRTATPGALRDHYYRELEPEPPHDQIGERLHIAIAGGLLAGDSERVVFRMIEMLEEANVRELVGGYLQEPPVLSAQKTTLRKADPSIAGAWHQDGKFLGDVNTLNLWLSLSHCGDTAPGMDLVPRRLDQIVDAGDGGDSFHEIVVSQEAAEKAAGELPILRPIFEPGDAMFFDHLYLHQTASDPAMPNLRYAIESWFFGPSAFPEDYIPLAY